MYHLAKIIKFDVGAEPSSYVLFTHPLSRMVYILRSQWQITIVVVQLIVLGLSIYWATKHL